ncbi:MAG: 50S ribosomal protein L24 [Deltaproteobacteria bacterium]
MLKIVKNDTVVVTAGKDRGKRGKVMRVLPDEGKVLVEGINVAIKHRRRTNQEQQHEGRVKMERPIAVGNVMVVCKSCSAPARIGFKTLEDGSKARLCKKCNETF